ncbi:MAG: valine--tRNA ligase [Bacteroidetes bacterium GWF2_43_63]|nr:MAG: valine--tRNA ligase [Bacteroidetes bacterium GWE2_42_42]OFY54021.1 MAG: valine--tRNA ligase [Bacteroidetes bacterium GWF2_43_63]HCB63571.1 valine--tRNA ligase [Bacteroidales bacterium]HCY23183.1 valine--tRNA ligase [Bacteroidales bacterium]
MEIPAKYDPTQSEDKWYAYWMNNGFFRSVPDERTPYTIVIPPPNVTGVLHMGHMLNNTLQDVLIRRARMTGFNACWVPGTDHASIATEAKVVAKLRAEGIDKKSLSRDEFLKHAWVWKEKHGGIILDQLKKLGASCDWDRTAFTMDQNLYDSVIKVFVDLYGKGLIYKGHRMVNWDPSALTAVSDEEVIYKEQNAKLYYLRYYLENSKDYLVIATTRPETILADTAVCVNPNDERFKHLHGKKVLVPLINRVIPVITDEYVDIEFGTGCLKITPAHDINDYTIGQKFGLEVIDILTPDGKLNEKAQLLIGEDRFIARKKIMKMLEESGNVEKIEDYVNKVGYSERTDVAIEPRLSEQWFMKMSDIAKPALDAVMSDKVQFHPAKFKNTYRHWMENVRDWCVSRQLWWGQRIPAWYLPDGSIVVALNEKDALEKAKKINPEIKLSDLKQDEDVLDTWFSSWLWPISVFNGVMEPDNKDIKYYYPTNDLITAPEIMFFWVARMVMAGLEYRKEIPFSNVYFTGIVRDKQGRKMSKSLGNSPDPIELMKKFGADGVRVGMMFSSPAGNDLLYDDSLCEQGRNFANKIWNAFRLISGWQVDEKLPQPAYASLSTEWFGNRLRQTSKQIDEQFKDFRLSDALMSVYKLVWDDFCSWYLEFIKPAYGQPIDGKTFAETMEYFDQLMRMLHPFMPFLTEEIWQTLKPRAEKESIMISSMPADFKCDEKLISDFELVQETIMAIRAYRSDKGIGMRDLLDVFFTPVQHEDTMRSYAPVIMKLGNLSCFEKLSEKPEKSFTVLVRTEELTFPVSAELDTAAEKEKLQKELDYTKGFLDSVRKKLSNEKFVSGAPAQVIDNERKKEQDALSRIAVLEKTIAEL